MSERSLAARLQSAASTQFAGLRAAGRVCTNTSGDAGMKKASTRLLEQETQTPSPAPDLIPAESSTENLHWDWYSKRGHFNPLHHDWLRFDCVYHLHKSRTETTTSEVFRCGIFACSSLFWRWCALHSESSSWVERCRIFTEAIFGHPQPAKYPWKRVRIVSRSTFAGNS